MKALRVIQIEKFAPGSESAAVTLQSDLAEVVAFCFPCDYAVGDLVRNRLSCGAEGTVQAAYLNDWPDDIKAEASKQRFERTGIFGYKGCGGVIDRERGLVEVLGFIIDFGDVPDTDVVEFECERLDFR